MSATVFGLSFLCAIVKTVKSYGECCKAYTDNFGGYHQQVWCDNYCCQSEMLGFRILQRQTHECCDDSSRQVAVEHRETMCEDWWPNNAWAPALIAIGSTAVLVGTGIFVYKFFIQKGDKVMPANTPRNVDHPRAQSRTVVYNRDGIPQPPAYSATAPPSGPPPPSTGALPGEVSAPSANSASNLPPHFQGNRNNLLPPIAGPSTSQPGMLDQPPSYDQSVSYQDVPQKKW